jgi:DNA polymerase-4
LCPEIQIVGTHHANYEKYGERVRQIYYRYTDLVEPFGGDECWLDVTASLGLLKTDGAALADELRRVVCKETGLTISVGVAWNKGFAKLASDMKKPDATTIISPENFKQKIFPLPAADLLYVGKRVTKFFEKLNIRTIGDLANYDPDILAAHIGINANKMSEMARGECQEPVRPFSEREQVKSVGNGTTLPYDLTTRDEVANVAYLLTEKVAFRMRKKSLKGTTVHMSVRAANLEWVGAQDTVNSPTNSTKTIHAAALKIFDKLWPASTSLHQHHKGPEGERDITKIAPVRSLRVAVSNLTSEGAMQQSLFADPEKRNDAVSAAFDKIRRKYGTKSVMFGTALNGEFELEFEVLDE